MCLSTPKAPPPPPTITPPPPPERAPSELENAVDSNATGLNKRRKGAKSTLGRGSSGAQYKGSGSGTGLKISK